MFFLLPRGAEGDIIAADEALGVPRRR